MKKLLIILLILVSFQATAQDGWKRLALFTSSVALNATGDALNDAGHKEWGHVCNAASIGVTLSVPLFTEVESDDWLPMILSYTFIRFAIFDYTYNGVRGLPMGYTGNSSYYDKAMQTVPNGFELWGKSIFLTAGIAINFNEL